jgi:hypothetical protein
MTLPNGWDGPPPPELLAAYADGELDGRDAVLPLKHKVEAWLRANAGARADVDMQRCLRRLWNATTPPEPDEAAWQQVLARLPQSPAPAPKAKFPIRWVAAAAVLVASAAGLAIYFWPQRLEGPDMADRTLMHAPSIDFKNTPRKMEPRTPLLDDGEVFAVATAEEIEILRVQGQDVRSLAVADPSLHRIELMGPGEAALTKQPPMRGVRMEGSQRPMIWARLDSEMHDD